MKKKVSKGYRCSAEVKRKPAYCHRGHKFIARRKRAISDPCDFCAVKQIPLGRALVYVWKSFVACVLKRREREVVAQRRSDLQDGRTVQEDVNPDRDA